MKIIVTGGSGLVGSAIKAISEDYENYSFKFLSSKDCDLSNFEETKKYFKSFEPDYVIHLAAYVGGLFKNINQKVDMFEKNIMINTNVIRICHEVGVQKVVSCLSTCIFPDKTTYPINEEMLHNGPPHNSNDAYAYAKRMLEVQSKAYQEQFGRNYVCVIPTNIYGEHDNYNLEDSHVIPGLIHRCYLSKKNNEKFIVRGTGKPLRQFIYSKDLAKLIMFVLEEYDQKNSIILSGDEKDEVSIDTVARYIARKFDYENNLVYDSSFSDGQFKKTADNTKLRNFLKQSEKYKSFQFEEISKGISNSVDWFIENYELARK
jgi:GDP-L-fucose synthase